MGFRSGISSSISLGGPSGNGGVGCGPRRSGTPNDHFMTTYDRIHNSMSPPASSLRQVGFLDLGNKTGQSIRQPRRTRSETSLMIERSQRPSTSPELGKAASLVYELGNSRIGKRPTQSPQKDAQGTPGTSSPEFWSINRGTQHMLEHTPRMIRRTVSELLTNPDVEKIAKHVFEKYGQKGKRNGQLSTQEGVQAIQTLIQEFSLPTHCADTASLLFKRFDVNHDDMLSFEEFFDLFMSMLRRAAFDKSTITGRNFFVSEVAEPVWDIWFKQKTLGQGAFGCAYLCKHKRSKEPRVIKAIKKSQSNIPVEDIEREIIIMRQIDHPNVVRLFGWHEDATSIYLVMESLSGGTLRDVLFHKGQKHVPIQEDWIRTVMGQVIEGMAFCHKLRLVHKDLKDENIMLLRQDPDYDKPFAVIIDLGLAEMFSHIEPRCAQAGGTPTTMAPEVWLDNFGPKCDVWSLGVVLYEMFTGCFPFIAKTLKRMAWVRLHKRGADWNLVRASPNGKALCQSMLTYAEDERPSMSDCLKHEWFKCDAVAKSKISPQQFAKLKQFTEETKLQRTLLLEIASRLPMEKAGQVVEMFKSFDTDRDGSLSKAEIRAAFSEIGMCDHNLIDKMFKKLDVNADGMLELSEFSAGVLVFFNDLVDDRLHALFNRRDRDGNGYLDAEEAKTFLADSTAMLTRDANHKSFDLLDELMQGGQTKIRYADLRGKLLGF